MKLYLQTWFLLISMGASAPGAFGAGARVKKVHAVPDGKNVSIQINLSEPVEPVITAAGNPKQLIIEFPDASFSKHLIDRRFIGNGVSGIKVGASPDHPSDTQIVVAMDSERPYVIKSRGKNFALSILPYSPMASPDDTEESTTVANPRIDTAQPDNQLAASPDHTQQVTTVADAKIDAVHPDDKPAASPDDTQQRTTVADASLGAAQPDNQPAPSLDDTQQSTTDAAASFDGARPDDKPVSTERATNGSEATVLEMPLNSTIEPPAAGSQDAAEAVPHQFKVKYISGNTVYIDGGTNAGLRPGMDLDILDSRSVAKSLDGSNDHLVFVASARVVAVATTSAVTEVGAADGDVKVGDVADLLPRDAAIAARSLQLASRNLPNDSRQPSAEEVDSSSELASSVSKSFRSTAKTDTDDTTRMAGRIGFDYSGIESLGSTPGTSTQLGVSVQTDMTHILGSHWNLQGYWRGRINSHSQFQQPTIEESLNKTYTMQLYYDNPNSKLVAGFGRLYLPWAVSLDTIDGGYLGVKLPLKMTTGVFGGSTPDVNSWHYRPNQQIAGSFVNFEGGDYERAHFTTTAGAAVNAVGFKLDRPFAFIESEFSYKRKLSVYHSIIADSLRGVSTNGARLDPGISHSYFTAHYQPFRLFSFDVYHNYFRDIPTATTTIVGTGLVDKLLFQGISGGIHFKPTRFIALYTTLGASTKTGDEHRSLNQMYGASWSEILHSGLRADFHYSRFDSNFGKGNYQVFSLSRQITNRAFWNVQVGKQKLLSQYTVNNNTIYVDDSLDVNIGRRSYLQGGYTYVNGASMNYRQWYFSLGFRFDKGKSRPEFVQTPGPIH